MKKLSFLMAFKSVRVTHHRRHYHHRKEFIVRWLQK